VEEFLIKILYFLIPCWLINSALNILGYLKNRYSFLEKIDNPLDFNYKFIDNRRVLGKSTTIIGLGVALLIGITIEFFLSTVFWGIIKGLCIYLGHALGSFIKRRLNFMDSKFLPIVDHGDAIILTGLVFLALNQINIYIFLFSLGLTYVFYPLICYIAYKLGLRTDPL